MIQNANRVMPLLFVLVVLGLTGLAMESCVGGGTTQDKTAAAIHAFHGIPDHSGVAPEARAYMTEQLYQLLRLAWDVPRWPDGEIGNEEFLFYFLTGNDGLEVGEVKSAVITSSAVRTCTVEVRYAQTAEELQPELIASVPITMIEENGKWLMDDFGSGVKQRCREYIQTEISHYLSGATTQYMRDNQHDEWYTDAYISEVETAFQHYLSMNAPFLEEIMRDKD